MNKTAKYLTFFVSGQATILFLLWLSLSNNLYSYKLVPFCTICAVIIDLCIVFGAMLNDVPNEDAKEGKHHKPYIEYVKEHMDKEDHTEEVIQKIYEPNEDRNADVRGSNQTVRGVKSTNSAV